MKLFYATGNTSKIYTMRRRLAGLPVELVTPQDLGLYLDVVEDGKTADENALKKAQAYYDVLHIPTVAGDSAFYIEGLPEDEQPGLHVRRVNGKDLSDEEMIAHYSAVAARMGGKVPAWYVTGLALVTDKGAFTVLIEDDHILLTDTVDTEHPHNGDPIGALSLRPAGDKRITTLTDAESLALGKTFEEGCMAFLRKHLLNNL